MFILVRLGAKVMITAKAVSKIVQVGENPGFQFLNDRINIAYLKFDDPKTGAGVMLDNQCEKQNSFVLIQVSNRHTNP